MIFPYVAAVESGDGETERKARRRKAPFCLALKPVLEQEGQRAARQSPNDGLASEERLARL